MIPESDLVLQKVTADEIEDLVNISIQTYRDQFEKDNNPEDFEAYVKQAFSKASLIKELENPDSSFYFAYLGEKLVAYIKLNTKTAQTDIQEPNAIELQRIYVYKEFQRKKIGERLVQKIVANASEKGYDYLWLGVWEHNPNAIRFYERVGFKAFSSHSFMVGTDEQTDILMKIIIR
ncbi:GNAT family N-acetyltransferase [Flavobacteriaceae bacterium R38]|nr:GNAT family N-acetyltransferase [Flavobacteriaceae bacterium R38]